MGFGTVRNLVARAWAEDKSSTIAEFREQFPLQAHEDMAFLAPVIGEVAWAVIDQSHPHLPKMPGAPKGDTGFPAVFRRLDGRPVRGAESEACQNQVCAPVEGWRIGARLR